MDVEEWTALIKEIAEENKYRIDAADSRFVVYKGATSQRSILG
ncbi:MAG: hypothetical protein ACP5SH_20160 [Syntrophobacteraceae bacterium]